MLPFIRYSVTLGYIYICSISKNEAPQQLPAALPWQPAMLKEFTVQFTAQIEPASAKSELSQVELNRAEEVPCLEKLFAVKCDTLSRFPSMVLSIWTEINTKLCHTKDFLCLFGHQEVSIQNHVIKLEFLHCCLLQVKPAVTVFLHEAQI